MKIWILMTIPRDQHTELFSALPCGRYGVSSIWGKGEGGVRLSYGKPDKGYHSECFVWRVSSRPLPTEYLFYRLRKWVGTLFPIQITISVDSTYTFCMWQRVLSHISLILCDFYILLNWVCMEDMLLNS
jgi:hypothetical protein